MFKKKKNELTGEARECRATSWADWAQLNTRYLLTSAKSRVRVNLKLYKLVQVPVHSCTHDTGIGRLRYKKKSKKKKKRVFLLHSLLVCTAQTKADESLISRARCCVPVLSAGGGNNKVDFFSGPAPGLRTRRVVSDAIHTIQAGRCTKEGWGVTTNISTLSKSV